MLSGEKNNYLLLYFPDKDTKFILKKRSVEERMSVSKYIKMASDEYEKQKELNLINQTLE